MGRTHSLLLSQTNRKAHLPSPLRALSSKPHLAQYVKHVTTTVILDDTPQLPIDVDALPKRAIARKWWLNQIIGVGGLPLVEPAGEGLENGLREPEWEDRFRGPNWDAMVSLLLIMFRRNLESFTVLGYKNTTFDLPRSSNNLICHVLEVISIEQKEGVRGDCLLKLRTVKIHGQSRRGGGNFPHISLLHMPPLLYSKSVERFHAPGVALEWPFDAPIAWQYRSYGI
ncbi:uncharacterized protein PAC_08987 [Phialocephala subalpina]|uniref:Uncharacterized protein n=1 Tax=Phialocephala subalpina TaxID=576137 RepID=A0A1L7X249_9HELO|nr:uncharacterized protein PAC_08987 [Phialocephala subalpina]